MSSGQKLGYVEDKNQGMYRTNQGMQRTKTRVCRGQKLGYLVEKKLGYVENKNQGMQKTKIGFVEDK